jgi:hypothetical protein
MTPDVIDAVRASKQWRVSHPKGTAMNTHPLDALIDAYLDAYSEPDRTPRATAVASIWAGNGRLIDPPLESQGHDGIVTQAEQLLSQFPGHRFQRSTGIDAHHGFARYGWNLLNPAGATVLAGEDFAEIDAAGQLLRVVGFFGALPALA